MMTRMTSTTKKIRKMTNSSPMTKKFCEKNWKPRWPQKKINKKSGVPKPTLTISLLIKKILI